MTALRASVQSAAPNHEIQQRFTVIVPGLNTMNQKIGTTMHTVEMRASALSTAVPHRKHYIPESGPVNNLKEFGGGHREQFREWARTLTEVMQQLRPGARAILREIDVTDKERWDKLAHDDTFLRFAGTT